MTRKPAVLSRANLLRMAVHLARILLILLAITAIVVPLWGFGRSLGSGAPSLDEYLSLNEVIIDPSGKPAPKSSRPFPIEAWINFKSIEPVDRVINIDLVLLLNDRRSLGSIIDRKDKNGVFAHSGDGQMTLLPKYRNLNLNLIISARSFEDLVTPVPLRRLSGPQNRPTGGFIVSAPLRLETAAYNRYPDDWYRVETFIAMQLPSELAWSVVGGDRNTIQPYLRFSNSLEPRDKSIYIEEGFQSIPLVGLSSQNEETNVTSFSVLIERQSLPRAFVWVIALTPALLIPVMIIQLCRTRKSSATPPIDRYISLELAAAVLAILPLRQVLVPAEVQGLTTIDYLLGAQLAIFIALVVIQYGFGLGQQRLPRELP